MMKNLLHRIKTENPMLCDIYDPKGHCFLKGFSVERFKKYQNKKGYKVKMVDNKKLTIELQKTIKFLEKNLRRINKLNN